MNRDAPWIKAKKSGMQLQVDHELLRWAVNHLKECFLDYKRPPIELPSDSLIDDVLRAIIFQSQLEIVGWIAWCKKAGAKIEFSSGMDRVSVTLPVMGEACEFMSEDVDLFTAIRTLKDRLEATLKAEGDIDASDQKTS